MWPEANKGGCVPPQSRQREHPRNRQTHSVALLNSDIKCVINILKCVYKNGNVNGNLSLSAYRKSFMLK